MQASERIGSMIKLSNEGKNWLGFASTSMAQAQYIAFCIEHTYQPHALTVDHNMFSTHVHNYTTHTAKKHV